jgi:hypothetical protein
MSLITDDERRQILGKNFRETMPPSKAASVEALRESLEIRRLQLELDKLEKPDTSIDYYSKMLELQKESFKAQLEMMQKTSELKVEIEKLKIAADSGGDFAEEFLYGLLPLLPELVKQHQGKQVKGGKEDVDKMVKMMNAKELEEYKQKIKDGLISLEQAWLDFEKQMPQMKGRVTKEQFSVEFEKLKNAKE